jgi:hypothetical protein
MFSVKCVAVDSALMIKVRRYLQLLVPNAPLTLRPRSVRESEREWGKNLET